MRESIVITSHIKDTNAEKNEKEKGKESKTLGCALGKDKDSNSVKDSKGNMVWGLPFLNPPF